MTTTCYGRHERRCQSAGTNKKICHGDILFHVRMDGLLATVEKGRSPKVVDVSLCNPVIGGEGVNCCDVILIYQVIYLPVTPLGRGVQSKQG